MYIVHKYQYFGTYRSKFAANSDSDYISAKDIDWFPVFFRKQMRPGTSLQKI